MIKINGILKWKSCFSEKILIGDLYESLRFVVSWVQRGGFWKYIIWRVGIRSTFPARPYN